MSTDEMLDVMRTQARKAGCKSCRYPEWGFDNLAWYIGSGRASLELCKKIEALKPGQMRTLIRRASSGSAEKGILNAKRYLGMSEESVI